MKTILTFAIFLFLFISCSDKSDNPAPIQPKAPTAKADFRRGVWGESKASILKKEKDAGTTVTEDTGNRVSFTNPNTIDTYIFTNGVLSSAEIIYTQTIYNHLVAYQEKRTSFRYLYGMYKEDTETWQSESIQKLYANKNAGEWSTAIVIGYLKLFTKWETDRSVITLSMAREHDDRGPVIFKASYSER